MEELIIGSHVSFTKNTQLVGSVKEALSYGSNAFMFYTGAPQNTSRNLIDKHLTEEAHKIMRDNNININNVIAHAPYIVNLANDVNNYDFSISFLKSEIKRCEELRVRYLVLHPGSHVSLGEEKGLNNIINALNIVLEEEMDVYICLETMAGKGSELGYSFEQINYIIRNVKNSNRLKVCLDTCHMNDAGYDIINFDNLLNEFDRIIGLDRVVCIHINDSKNIRGSHKDRHENIGYGDLGFENIINIIYHDKLKNVPKILETPYVTKTNLDKKRLYPPYKFEIEMIKKKEFNSELIEQIRNYYM